jgi:hypothetical protein
MTTKPSTTVHYPLLTAILWISGLTEIFYFTSSHWFYRRAFFNFLGIYGADLESTYVQSQLQLIGMLVLGYALMNFIIASDPVRYRPIMALIFIVGIGCVAIFIAHVIAGTLPIMFLVNAALLAAQLIAVAVLFPWKTQAVTKI